MILLCIATVEVSALSFDSFLVGLQHISRLFSKKADHGTHRLILARAATASNCTSPCSWIINTQSCPTDNLECDCGFVVNAGIIGVAACADCFDSVNTTLANEAVQIGLYCGVNAVSQVTFSYTLSTPTTTFPATTLSGGPTSSPITASSSTSPLTFGTITVIETSASSARTSQTSSSSQFPEPAANIGTSSSAGGSGLSGGAIGGIVGGIVGGFFLLGALLFLWLRRKLTAYPSVAQQPPMTYVNQPQPKEDAPTIPSAGGAPSGRLRYPEGEQMQEAPSGRLSRAY